MVDTCTLVAVTVSRLSLGRDLEIVCELVSSSPSIRELYVEDLRYETTRRWTTLCKYIARTTKDDMVAETRNPSFWHFNGQVCCEARRAPTHPPENNEKSPIRRRCLWRRRRRRLRRRRFVVGGSIFCFI